jgi:hypothetical protein
MNRQQRRAAASMRRPDTRTPVEFYRVPPGRVALTFDLGDRPPSTISISAASLVGVLDSVEKLIAGRSYQQVLFLLQAAIEAADADKGEVSNAGLIGFWLATNHPHGGAEMVARLSDAIALDGRAHLTMHAGRDRGIAFALCDRFVDLDRAAARAREAGVATFAFAEPRRQRPGGHA